MITYPTFLLLPGKWEGEGTVSFSTSEEQLFFETEWTVEPQESGVIQCKQRVKMEGADEEMLNHFEISGLQSGSFIITLSNHIVDHVEGKGVIDAGSIAWEFLSGVEMQGYESYKPQSETEYSFHAEYNSTEDMRTIIDGAIQLVRPE